ncbi:xylulokinase [Ekhidna sp.]|uniref:xylulokinase n=1 Tax=Ekhidna sp. TaxID=2608089 RepID=UPI003CCBD175
MYLIINLGLKSIRGILFNELGHQLYSKSFPVHTTLFDVKVEQDVNEWVDLLDKIMNDISENTNLSREIKFVSVTTSSSCIVGVDKLMNPITKVLMVSDKRSLNEVKSIKSTSLFRKYEKQDNLTCATASLIPKALWFKNNEPQTFENVKYWLGAAEYLNYYFTGEVFTDPLNASKAFHNGSDYCNEIIEDLGIDISTLPKVTPIGTTLSLDNTLKSRFNLSQDCKFILTTYDAICAVIGSSNGENYNACDVSGTVTSLRLLNDKPSNASKSVLLNQRVDLLDKYLIGASNNLGGGIIEWYKQAFFKKGNQSVYFKMENDAQSSKVGANGLLFIPYLLGERAPVVAPDASACFFGVQRSHKSKDFSRAVFESTAYVTRHLMELIEDGSIDVNSITVSGGLARFDLINQIKADVCNKPVYVVENFESTSIGAFILMAISNNQFNSIEEALKKVVRIRKIINPSTDNHKIYYEYFSLYKKLIESLTPIYKAHNDIQKMQVVHENETVRNL